MKMEKGAVAFLDLLGAKGIWARTDPDELVERWESVVASIEGLKARFPGPVLEVEYQAFSDTIIVTLASDGLAQDALIAVMGMILREPFWKALKSGFFFRGVVSYGTFFRSGSLLVGPSIDEAAEWYQLADWSGVCCSPSAGYAIDAMGKKFDDHTLSTFYVRYDVPTKAGGKFRTFALAWPLEADRTELLCAFSRHPIGASAHSKYENTLAFFDYVRSQVQEQSSSSAGKGNSN